MPPSCRTWCWDGAETNADGAVVNVIPKEDGNTFSAILFGLYTNEQEAAFFYHFDPNVLFQVAWSAPLTNRPLFEAGPAATISHWHRFLIGEESDISHQGLGSAG